MRARKGSERGMSLIEVLVATAILAVAIVVALTVYDASRKAFSKGENATEQQESVRIAFDLMTSQIRMLGLNANPDGDPARPDEQLEGALDHAVIFRGDFDRMDPVTSQVPETSLDGGAFRTVSTGNDEIIAYVLSKPDGTGPDTITFKADVKESQRDGSVEPVAIGNVVLNPTSPPYTLYRVTLNNDPATYGSPGFLVRVPVVENVRDLSFIYYSTSGMFKDASSTIPENVVAKETRSGLTRVHVSLVGMTRQQDLNYLDPSDPASAHHRKFELKGDVTPRNMRFKGIQDLNADVTPPTKPATPTLVPGHCGGLFVTWTGNPLSEGVTQYRVNWGPNSGVVSGSRNLPGPPAFLDQLTTGATYFVSIQAQDAQGNLSVKSDLASATVVNLNRPSPPTGLTTSTDETYHVTVSWTPATTNTAEIPAADPLAPRIRDLAGYRLYWNRTSPVTLANRQLIVDEGELPASFQQPYLDTPLVACMERYYVLTAVDGCGWESAPTPVSLGKVADAGVNPRAPTEMQAQYVGAQRAIVRWRPIRKDVAGKSIRIERYEVFRSAPIDPASGPESATWVSIGVTDDTFYEDNAVPVLAAGEVVYYRVNGSDSCVNASDYSSAAKLDCSFSGEVEFVTPADGDSVWSPVSTTVRVAGGTDVYTSIEIRYEHSTGVVTGTFTSSTPGTSWTDSGWPALPIGDYTITATVTNAAGCSQIATVNVTAIHAPAPN
jgi:prepilin-type N-terminal cleavage/methylation domain-containing protein